MLYPAADGSSFFNAIETVTMPLSTGIEVDSDEKRVLRIKLGALFFMGFLLPVFGMSGILNNRFPDNGTPINTPWYADIVVRGRRYP